MKTGKKRTVTTVITMLVIAATVIALYYGLTNGTKKKSKEEEPKTEVEKLIAKDIAKEFPETPRETVKLYSRIISCFYKETITEEELEKLVVQIRLLFDEELNENNPYDAYLERLKSEIADYKGKKLVIDNYQIEKGSSVSYYEKDEKEYANVLASYILRDEKKHTNTNEQFILRKDEKEQWKILGWQLVNDVDFDNH